MVVDRLFVCHIRAGTTSSIALVLLLIGWVPCLGLRKRSIANLTSVSLIWMKTEEVVYLLLLIIRSSYFHVRLLEIGLFHVTHHGFLLHGILLRAGCRLSRWRISVQVSSVRIWISISRGRSWTTSLRLGCRVLATCEDHFAASSRTTLALKLSPLTWVVSTSSLFLLDSWLSDDCIWLMRKDNRAWSTHRLFSVIKLLNFLSYPSTPHASIFLRILELSAISFFAINVIILSWSHVNQRSTDHFLCIIKSSWALHHKITTHGTISWTSFSCLGSGQIHGLAWDHTHSHLLSASISLLLVELLLKCCISLLTHATCISISISLIQIISLTSLSTILISRPLTSFYIARNTDWSRSIHYFFSIALSITLVVIDVIVFWDHALLAIRAYCPAIETLNDAYWLSIAT